MALVECPNCHRKIIASAASCFHCGQAIQRSGRGEARQAPAGIQRMLYLGAALIIGPFLLTFVPVPFSHATIGMLIWTMAAGVAIVVASFVIRVAWHLFLK